MLEQLLSAFAKAGIQPVLIKGTALAYSLYPSPVLRTRGDTDLIVGLAARDRAEATLVSSGFKRELAVSGEFISYQACYVHGGSPGEWHTIDLHWKINNSEVLASLFTHAELLQRSRRVPALGPDALMTSEVDALLLACMHRATHKQNPYYVDGEAHYGGDRLIWLYDIHLLATRFGPPDWAHFLTLAKAKGLRTVCAEGLQRASDRFATPLPLDLLASLSCASTLEPASRYLSGTGFRQQWMDFRAIPGALAKARFLRELAFPNADYMRQKYPSVRPGWLPWLYCRRAVGGALKKLLPVRDP